MGTLHKELEKHFTAAIASAFNIEHNAEITQSTQEHFGHYQCNSALKLSKILKQNPRAIAEKIVASFSHPGLVSSLEIAGAGFINIRINKERLERDLDNMLRDKSLGIKPPSESQKVIVEFSSPNIAKELHVGHLRSTIIGESLARLFEFLGFNVLRLNHIGDWGTQFGMLISYIKEKEKGTLDKGATLSHLMKWYKESKALFDADEAFKKRAQKEVVALQSGELKAREMWEKICHVSRIGFEEIYQLLDVSLVERGESFYNPMLKEIVDDFVDRGLSKESEGATCVFMEGFLGMDNSPLPMIIQKGDGGYNYSTTDLAAIKHRVEVEKADRIIYVVDAGQKLHLQMVFAGARLAKYLDPNKVRLDHVDFGVVLGEDGKKFKTRSGETVRLLDLLKEACDRAKILLEERNYSKEEIDHASCVLGINAVKYADLSCHRIKDYQFSFDRMLKFEGNTAAFLLYAYVRIQSIKRKIDKPVEEMLKSAKIELDHPSEMGLALHLRQFDEMLISVSEDLCPNRLCDYLFTLAEKFNLFFRDCHVQGDPKELPRLALCELSSQVFEKGLHILGLQTLQRM
jgi:arginyl-tRNA synthetase